MTAAEIFAMSAEALAITDPPEWDTPDAPDQRDVLAYVDEGDGGSWCLAPSGSPDSEYVPVDTGMAGDLIRSWLRDWLLGRGWQVHSTLRKEAQRWRLVDVLSIADGGGDRLDDEYPYGTDELEVLCASVVVIAGALLG